MQTGTTSALAKLTVSEARVKTEQTITSSGMSAGSERPAGGCEGGWRDCLLRRDLAIRGEARQAELSVC